MRGHQRRSGGPWERRRGGRRAGERGESDGIHSVVVLFLKRQGHADGVNGAASDMDEDGDTERMRVREVYQTMHDVTGNSLANFARLRWSGALVIACRSFPRGR
jgi:hypothetical protein